MANTMRSDSRPANMGDFRVDQVDGLYGSDAPEDPPEATLALDTPIDYEEVRTIIAERKPGKRRIRSLIVISGLLLVFVPATLSLALNYSKTLLIVPAVIVAITVSGFMLLRSSVKLDADSPFAASRGAWHVINRVGGVFGKKFPYISPADYSQQVNEEGSLQQQADLDEYEWRLFKENKAFNSGRSVVVTVVNVKGGSSKTPISAMLAIFFGLITRRVLTAIDFNPFAGNLAVWMGIEPGRIRMRELVDRIKYAGSRLDFNKFSNGLGENDYNNQLVPSNITAERESLTVEVVNVVLGSAIGNSNHVVCDTSNNIGAPALKEILESTDVIVVAGLCKEDKLDGVVETLANFTAWDWHERVRHAVIVLTDLAPGRTVESYRKELKLDENVIITAIPHDESLTRFRAIHPRNLSQEARIGIMETLFVATHVAAHTKKDNRKGWKEPALSFTLGQLVPLSSGRTPVLSYIEPHKAA